MLELLVKYARDHDLKAEPGFKPKPVRWFIVCDKEGRFLDVAELGDTEAKKNPGQPFQKCPDLSQPELVSGSEMRSHFLVDTAEVVALLGKGSEDPKVQEKHRYFVKLLREAGRSMPELATAAHLLEDEQFLLKIRERLQAGKAKPTDKVTLKVGDCVLVESDAWHDWWREFRRGLSSARTTKKSRGSKGESAHLMRCFASGEMVEPVATHPKITGLADVGGQASGSALIGFDKDAFRSYHLSQSANAAVSEGVANAYRAAIDDLLRKHSQRLAGAKVIHWFKKHVPPEDDPLAWLEVGEEEQERSAQQRAEDLLESLRTGKRVDLLGNYFYAMTLSGSGGRVMVRDWMEGQFERLLESIHQWFSDLEIVNWSGSKAAKTPGLEKVITSLLPPQKPQQRYDDWVKPIGAERLALWHAATRWDTPIPYSVLSRLVVLDTKFRVSGTFEDALKNHEKDPKSFAILASLLHARMGLMKAYHLRKERMKGGKEMPQDLKPYLNEDHPSPAYHCGRLMAVLADVQRAALGDVGAGVVQRYYAAASATPALVLGRLTRTSQFHLNKLEPGLAHWFETIIAGIWGRIKDTIPRTLTLEEQSLFALGYYQQMARIKAGKTDSK